MSSEPSSDASAMRAWVMKIGDTRPAIAMASDTGVTGGQGQFAQLLKRGVHRRLPPFRHAVPHSMVRGAMRLAARSGSSMGDGIGDLPGALPTPSRRVDVAVSRPHRGAHVPAVGGGTSPAASRCSAISAAFSSAAAGSRDSIAAATRRCSSARSDLSCDS